MANYAQNMDELRELKAEFLSARDRLRTWLAKVEADIAAQPVNLDSKTAVQEDIHYKQVSTDFFILIADR